MVGIGAWMIRHWHYEYPLSSGAVDYKRIAWPVGKSGTLPAPTWKSGTVAEDTSLRGIPYYLDAQNRPHPLPMQSTSSYTPVLEDTDIVATEEPYAPDERLLCADVLHSEYTGQPYDPEWGVPIRKGLWGESIITPEEIGKELFDRIYKEFHAN